MFEVAMMNDVPKSTLVHLPFMRLGGNSLTQLFAASSAGAIQTKQGGEQGEQNPTDTRK